MKRETFHTPIQIKNKKIKKKDIKVKINKKSTKIVQKTPLSINKTIQKFLIQNKPRLVDKAIELNPRFRVRFF